MSSSYPSFAKYEGRGTRRCGGLKVGSAAGKRLQNTAGSNARATGATKGRGNYVLDSNDALNVLRLSPSFVKYCNGVGSVRGQY
jgi:hypothetical protein